MKRFLLFLAAAVVLTLHSEWWDGSCDWHRAKKVAPGIVRTEWKVSSPRKVRIYAMRIDLHTRGLRFHVTPKAEKYGEKMPDAPDFIIRTRRQTTRAFVDGLAKKNIPVAAAFNAVPWSPWRAPFTHKYADRMGMLISDGDVILPPDGRRPSFLVMKDGKAEIALVKAGADIRGIRHAVSGFSFVLNDGKVLPANDKALAPRTGYGLSKDRRFFYVFVADGRQNNSQGLTHREVGTLLRFLGAHVGLNMDGGGSSTMIVRERGKTVMLNRQPGGAERTVGASLAVSVSR